MPQRGDLKKILILGSGPIVIGQACEFDYSGTQACKALKKAGYEIILVNSNPASIMTDLVRGKEEKEVKEIVTDFLDMIKEKDELTTQLLNEDEKTKLMCLSGVKQYPMRVKCATLSWHTLTSAMNNSQEIASTED